MSSKSIASECRSAEELDRLYRQRLHRFVTAMRNDKPDRVPIRPFLAEFCGKLTGHAVMEVTHDIEHAFAAVRETAKILDVDALVGNMVYVWTGLTQALGLKYYGVPGFDCLPDHGFQYREPPEEKAWMRPEEYDHLIDDPTGYLYEVWLPRISTEIVGPGETCTYRNQLALVKGSLAMLHYFQGFGRQAQLMRTEAGMPGALSGILKAPMDILADKLRGYLGLLTDLRERPEKVKAACEALAPHMLHTALSGADPQKLLPIGFWMHRSCAPFINPKHFHEINWPTLKPIIENIWAAGHQTLFYAEGKWGPHLESFQELPDRSIIYHVDRDDVFEVHRKLGKKFCISGGVPNTILTLGTPDRVRECCKKILDEVAVDGGYIMDASAIVQEDAKEENVRAMIEFTREYGGYGTEPCDEFPQGAAPEPGFRATDISGWQTKRRPGVCIPWSEKQKELPPVQAREDLVERIWSEIDGLGNMFIYQVLVSF